MSKFQDFYAKALADANVTKELSDILAGKALEAASDEQLEKVSGVAKRLGFDITVAEARNFLKEGDKKLSDDDLDAVAGGASKNGSGGGSKSDPHITQVGGNCDKAVGNSQVPIWM